ncbi:hypothetical protein L6Q21_09745 [Sandaracinobacter sp. RS1-74]|uniref:hypothetical protein n=1 Tax=Sandaracinobacteroides sayramensis TaxID=2913411 RepID=UPI001EDBEDD2|nr:hypothetical protein [Sandaracinobacteroides sayramensis]MCG2841262.1 hypothetical protein [Sandaracinobacteroides sayramensis]
MMIDAQLDQLVDNASHASFETIPDRLLTALTADERAALLFSINDALTPILRDLAGEPGTPPAVCKVTLEITLLATQDDADRLDDLNLTDIAREMDDGAFVGTISARRFEAIAPTALRDELLALGNDGTFFDGLGE